MGIGDIGEIAELQPEGWYNVADFFSRYFGEANFFPIAAVENGKLAGIANGIINGNVAWLGNIVVHKDFRRKGIGLALTKSIIELTESRGCKTQLLVATNDGYPIYSGLGFEIVCLYNYYKVENTDNNYSEENIHQAGAEDFSDIIKMDSMVSAEDREYWISQNLSNAIIYKRRNKLCGYYLPEAGEGTIVAINEEAGIELLKYKISFGQNKIVIPEKNKVVQKFMKKNNIKKYDSLPRMIYGEMINWKPENIYNRISGFIG